MTISDSHASHIRKVNVSFVLSSPSLDPAAVTESLGIPPDRFASRGTPRVLPTGQVLKPWDHGWWRLDSDQRVASKDINNHLNVLLQVLLPKAALIRGMAPTVESHVGVLWQSTYLYAGTGPLIDAACLAGIAALGAGMGFDIYQIDEPDAEDDA